jgi:hypothetical protein
MFSFLLFDNSLDFSSTVLFFYGCLDRFSHFHFSYVDARLYVDHENSHLYSVSNDDFERPCTKHCPCLPLRERAHSDPYVFSLATNPFYLWLICTIFTEAGEEFVPKTLTQLYTWVMLVFAHR